MAEVRPLPPGSQACAPTAIADPKQREALARLYRAVRFKPSDPDARIALAEALVTVVKRLAALRHVRRSMRDAPSAWGGLSIAGDILFRLGERKAAYTVLSLAHERGCLNARSHRTYAALLHAIGREAKARRMLGVSAFMQPVSTPRSRSPGLPDVLRLRSFDKSRYAIRKSRESGLLTRSLKSGHFSVSNLIAPGSVNMWIMNAFGDSLSTVDRIPPVSLIVNSVACPDLNPLQLGHIGRFLKRFPEIGVINRPERVLATTRARNARRLSAIEGVRFPRTIQIALADLPEQTLSEIEAQGITYPLILREVGTQTGISMEKVSTRAEALAYLEGLPPGRQLFAIEFLDHRDAAGHYRKTRVFYIDGGFFPVANLTNDNWQIHSGDRYRIMADLPEAQERERHFLAAPADYLGTRAMNALHAVRDTIQLDFFGVDFCLHPDGDIVIYEANAAMRHNYDHAERFPYTRPHLDRIGAAFTEMILKRAQAHEAAQADRATPGPDGTV